MQHDTRLIREIEERLADFVAQQHFDFVPEKWLDDEHHTGATLLQRAAVAEFLYCTASFGYERPIPAWVPRKQELLALVTQLDPAPRESVLDRIRLVGLEPSRFAAKIDGSLHAWALTYAAWKDFQRP